MPNSAASDLGLHCLPNALLGVSRLQWVKDSNLQPIGNICVSGLSLNQIYVINNFAAI